METIRFIHISDSHISFHNDDLFFGLNQFNRTLKVVDLINQLPFKPDFVIHTGDIVADPALERYNVANDLFRKIECPIYYVAGNHDCKNSIKEILHCNNKITKFYNNRFTYAFKIKNYNFLVLDAFDSNYSMAKGIIASEELKILKEVLHDTKKLNSKLAIFVHYPALSLDCEWMDESTLISNGNELHEILLEFREHVSGVFYGHAHRNMQTLKNGILYSCVGSLATQFIAMPNEKAFSNSCIDIYYPPCFNIVTITADTTLVKGHIA